MKKVTLTNATVIPFYVTDQNAPVEVLRIAPKNPEYKTQMVSFNIETPVDDNPNKKAKLFQSCTYYAKSDEQVEKMKGAITNGALVEIEGKETRVKGKPDQNGKDRYFNNIVVEKIVPISSGIEDSAPEGTEDDGLPF